jgi:glucosamine--fructose-6-phosphate aminotransferase (isomerizing)
MSDHTRDEIQSQPETWRLVLESLESLPLGSPPPLEEYDLVLFTGCGSTYYLSQWAARQGQILHGVPCVAVPASDFLLYPEAVFPRDRRQLLVAISRSGETTETLRAVEAFRERGKGDTVAVTCYPERLLAQRTRWAVNVPAAREQSVVQTRSFTSMLLGVAWWIGGERPADLTSKLVTAGGRVLRECDDIARQWASDPSLARFFYLGSGPFFGLASEGMLKIKEMALAHSEAYHFPEIRHGPMALVNESSLVIGLLGDGEQAAALHVLRDMRELGARTAVVREGDGAGPSAAVDLDVRLESGLPSLWGAPLYLLFLQQLAYHRAVAHGMDPDQPRHLSSVVVLHE